MAIADNYLLIDGVPGKLRLPHFANAIALWTGTAENTYSAAIDQSAVKTAINSAQATICDTENTAVLALRSTAKVNSDALIETFKTLWPFADETAFDTACDTLKADIEAEIDNVVMDNAGLKTDLAAEVNSGVPSTANILKTTVLTDLKTEFNALTTAVRTYVCPRCKNTGTHALNQNPNTDASDTTQVPCESCGQHGATVTQNIAIGQGWSLTEAY